MNASIMTAFRPEPTEPGLYPGAQTLWTCDQAIRKTTGIQW